MKKVVSLFAVAAFLFAMNVNAQEKPAAKNTKTEKTCSAAEKKSCAGGEKKGSCCSAKKASDKKA